MRIWCHLWKKKVRRKCSGVNQEEAIEKIGDMETKEEEDPGKRKTGGDRIKKKEMKEERKEEDPEAGTLDINKEEIVEEVEAIPKEEEDHLQGTSSTEMSITVRSFLWKFQT